MALKTMYPAVNSSVPGTLTDAVSETDTTLPLTSTEGLPPGPNIATVSYEEDAELVFYAEIEGNDLAGCVRGYNGTRAQVWETGTAVYRAYTAVDHETFVDNITSLDADKLSIAGDGSAVRVTLPTGNAGGEIQSGDTLAVIAAKTRAGLAKSTGLRVLALESLPEEVTPGTIVVTTDTPTEDIILSLREPELVEGRIWVHVMPGGEGLLTESGESILRAQGTYQAMGGEWALQAGFYAQLGEWVRFSVEYTMMGYSWNYGEPSPLLTRLESAEGLTASPAVGTIAGHSDFDTMPIYKDIRRCNLAADGTVNAYEGDDGYTVDGSNGDVMVEIPRFWYKRTDDPVNKIQTFLIADRKVEGFAVYPLFDRGDGVVRKKAYIAAYETSAGHVSKSGVALLGAQTRDAFRGGARDKGAGWSLQDATARLGVAELIRIEYATHKAQEAIGKGNTEASQGIIQPTGVTDAVAGHTGRAAGANDATPVKWRGLENWWGNVEEMVDGVNFNNGTLYYCLDQTNFADGTAEGYTELSFTIPIPLTIYTSYGTGLGYDEAAPWAAFPNTFDDGSGTTYLTDTCRGGGSNWRNVHVSHERTSGSAAGISYWAWYNGVAYSNISAGSRLLYLPEA